MMSPKFVNSTYNSPDNHACEWQPRIVCRILYAVVIASAVVSPATSQSQVSYGTSMRFFAAPQSRFDPQRDLEQARQREELGRYDEAVSLYERILRVKPDDAQALSSLLRLYIRLKRFDPAVSMLLKQIEDAPKNVVYRRMLADVYFSTDREIEGRQQCEMILENYPRNEAMYRVVSAIYRDQGMYHQSTETLIRGRSAIEKPFLYARNLADIFTTLGEIPEATREYILLLKDQPRQFDLIDDRIEQLTELRGDAPVIQEILVATSEESVTVEVFKLLGNFHLRRNRASEALSLYEEADLRNGGDGRLLLEFGLWSTREQHYDESIAAYLQLMDRTLPVPILAKAALGLADVYRLTDRIDEAAATYRLISSRYAGTAERAEAGFQLADLQLTHYSDAEAALAALRLLQSSSGDKIRKREILFRIGDCHLALGNLDAAEIQYTMIADPSKSGLSDDSVSEEAAYRLAELQLFGGDVDGAAESFTMLAAEFLGGDLANDALEWSLLLGSSGEIGAEALASYIEALLLQRQYRTTEALDHYKQFLNDYPDSPISDLAILDIGQILTSTDRPHEAIAAYRDLLEKYPASRHAVKAQERIAHIFEVQLQDIPQSITEYQTILVNYPANVDNDAIRRRIRTLTENNPPIP